MASTTNQNLVNNIETHTGISDHLLLLILSAWKQNCQENYLTSIFINLFMKEIILNLRSSISL